MLLVFVALNDKAGLQLRGNLHIIISVDAQDVFHHIARTLNIDTISGNFELQTLGTLAEHLHLQRVTNALDSFDGNVLTNQRVNIAVLEVNNGVLHLLRINVLDFHRHLTSCQFLAKLGGIFQCVNHAIGIDATLETERSIGAQTMTASRLTNPRGMEVSTLEHDVLRGLIRTTTLSAKDASDTHGFLGVANSEVAVRELVLLTIQRHKRSAFRHRLHHNLVTLHHVGIETVQGLPQHHHHVVGDVDDVIDWT